MLRVEWYSDITETGRGATSPPQAHLQVRHIPLTAPSHEGTWV